MIQSTPVGNYRYQGIDAAKTGELDSYEHYQEVNKRISKAIGGKRGRMPFFFAYTRNGRREDGTPPERCAPANNSTMNRICMAFNDVNRLNFAKAGIAPFNYQMLLDENDTGYDQQVVDIFADAASEGMIGYIQSAKLADLAEKGRAMKSELLSELIAERVEAVMPLEQAYRSIVKALFAQDRIDKTSCKQEFWNVFGHIALEKLKRNLSSCTVCEKCGCKVPTWAKSHHCPKNIADFFECISCGAIERRTNSRQCRCAECQKAFRKMQIRKNVLKLRKRRGSATKKEAA